MLSSQTTSHKSLAYRHTLNIVKFIGNGVGQPHHREVFLMPQGSYASVASMKPLTFLCAGTLFQMTLTVDPLAWMHSPILSNSSRKCVERHKQSINQVTLRWLLTSSLRTNPHPCFQAVPPTLAE